MNNQSNSLLNWAYFFQGKSMEELRQCLLYTTVELEQTRGAAQEELRKKDDQLVNLKDLLNKTIRERDEAQEKYQRLFLDNLIFQQQPPLSGISSIENNNNNALSLSSSDCEESIVSSPVTTIQPQPSVTVTEYSMNIELTPDKPLPEKGKLLQAVMKAGPLLQTLLLAGPLPQWRHPPPPLQSFQIPPVTIPPPPQFLHHQDSIFGSPNNISTSNTNSQCGRLSKKRNFSDGSDSSPTQNNKYQRVVLH